MNFDGIYTPAITPLNEHGQIHYQAFAEVLESLIDAKVHGIIIGGSTGEYYAHTLDERAQLARYAKQVIGNRLPLIIGTGATRTEDAIALATLAKDIQANAILIGSPPYALPTETENADHALAIDAACGLPIMLYNYPARMGVKMGQTFLDKVTSQSQNFQAIKESTGDTYQLHLLACQYPQLQISCGWDDQALEFFAWGAKSWVCAGSNFLPKEHIALYKACVLEKDFSKARQIMTAMMPLMNFLEEAGKFVQSIKYGCTMIGLNSGGVRKPLAGLTPEEQEQLTAIIQDLKHRVAAIVG